MVTLVHPNQQVWKALEEKWPDCVRLLSDHAGYVAPPDITLTTDVGKAAGMSKEGDVTGMVVELFPSSYYGFGPGELWEWVRKHL